MKISQQSLVAYLNDILRADEINDYCPNGLQVEGKTEIRKIVTGVTASQALIDAAIEQGADAILVHHGYFWKGESQPVTGMKKRRIKALLDHDINLIAYHLPIDVHPEFGNNAQLGKLLGFDDITPLDGLKPKGIVMTAQSSTTLTQAGLKVHIEQVLGRTVLAEGPADKPIHSLAWCTGGGQGYIEQAAQAGIDAFISGEVSEQTIHTAREMGVHFFAAGHHATERYGAKAVGEHLQSEFDLDVVFIDIPNPA